MFEYFRESQYLQKIKQISNSTQYSSSDNELYKFFDTDASKSILIQDYACPLFSIFLKFRSRTKHSRVTGLNIVPHFHLVFLFFLLFLLESYISFNEILSFPWTRETASHVSRVRCELCLDNGGFSAVFENVKIHPSEASRESNEPQTNSNLTLSLSLSLSRWRDIFSSVSRWFGTRDNLKISFRY